MRGVVCTSDARVRLAGTTQHRPPPSHPPIPPPHLPPPPPKRNIFPIWALGLYRRLVLGGARRVAPEARPQGDAAGWVCAVSDYYTA